jgi:adenylosuccinate synthase
MMSIEYEYKMMSRRNRREATFDRVLERKGIDVNGMRYNSILFELNIMARNMIELTIE